MIAKWRRNLPLNVKLPEAIVRMGLGMILPILLAWFRSLPFIILICIVSAYLLITGMLFFCFIKHFFQHTITGKKSLTQEEKTNPLKEL